MGEAPRWGCAFQFWASLSLSLLILQSVSAENIVSRPVGFLRINVPSNAQILASQPFSSLDETNSSPLLKWEAASGYTSSMAIAEPGEGFWLVNKQPENQMVFLAGEIALSPSNTALLHPGLNLVGYPYSSPLPLNQTALGALTSSVQILNADATTPLPEEQVMGKGFWVKSLSEECIVWTEVRPYKDVFPTSGLPDIAALASEDGSNMILSIACSGIESFDVFYQDINPTNAFDTTRNWNVAEAGLLAGGRTEVEWIDSGSGDRAAPGSVLGRYYLVSRADIDMDNSGVPDGRERFVAGAAPGVGIDVSYSGDQTSILSGVDSFSNNPGNELAASGSTHSGRVQVVSMGRIIFVDRARGNDLFTGRAALVVSGDGPKKTIRAGLNAAQPRDVLVVREGSYSENLNIAGRNLKVRVEGNVNIAGRVREMPNVVAARTNGLPR